MLIYNFKFSVCCRLYTAMFFAPSFTSQLVGCQEGLSFRSNVISKAFLQCTKLLLRLIL